MYTLRIVRQKSKKGKFGMNLLTRFKIFLWKFSHFQVPMIGYLKPKLIKLTDDEVIIRIPLNRRSRNHLHSMYFGALAVGADLAGGLHGFYHALKKEVKVSLVFKSFQAQFLRRPDGDVYFVCDEGAKIAAMIEETHRTGQRVTKEIHIKAYTDFPQLTELVVTFVLELSLKKPSNVDRT
jgi:acyl-coenzyme A thioesterase PaaI-like protein